MINCAIIVLAPLIIAYALTIFLTKGHKKGFMPLGIIVMAVLLGFTSVAHIASNAEGWEWLVLVRDFGLLAVMAVLAFALNEYVKCNVWGRRNKLKWK
jgi:hypothetical protein